MPSSRRRHKTAEQWQKLIEQYHASGQSGVQFCRAQGIGYASFCKWRQRLADGPEVQPEDRASLPSFIDLGRLSGQAAPGWQITLRLGNGIELCLSQS